MICGGQYKMSRMIKKLCEEIAETFGHEVDPKKLQKLIESSPLPPEEEEEEEDEEEEEEKEEKEPLEQIKDLF